MDTIESLIAEVEKMLPLYEGKKQKSLKPYLDNLRWNLKKVRGEKGLVQISQKQWMEYTEADFSNIALLLPKTDDGVWYFSLFSRKVAAINAPAKAIESAETAPIEVATPTPRDMPIVEAGVNESAQDVVSSDESAEIIDKQEPEAPPFDVRTHLQSKAMNAGEKLEWQTSVVDLMKLMGLESSLSARRKLAKALECTEEEIAAVGSEEGNESLRTLLVGHLAANQGKIALDDAWTA